MSKYKVSEPSALKFLKENGAVVDENGNVIQEATEFWKQKYEQAEPKPAKYLHADGTIDENPGSGGGGADLEDNKTATIDVSTYTEPVEIEPTAGKDGMKKATVTLSNIPSGGEIKLALWHGAYGTIDSVYAPFVVAPLTLEDFSKYDFVIFKDVNSLVTTNHGAVTEYTRISDTKFIVVFGVGTPIIFELDPQHILILKTS